MTNHIDAAEWAKLTIDEGAPGPNRNLAECYIEMYDFTSQLIKILITIPYGTDRVKTLSGKEIMHVLGDPTK